MNSLMIQMVKLTLIFNGLKIYVCLLACLLACKKKQAKDPKGLRHLRAKKLGGLENPDLKTSKI